MATFNGALYIREQIISILAQMDENDELVVTDDCSSDNTVEIVESFRDTRIRLFRNEARLGYVQNFARAITHSKGKYIALSDQDDFWPIDRLKKLLNAINEDNTLVIGDFMETGHLLKPISSGNNGKSLFVHQSPFLKFFAIMLGRSKYFGCCFLFSRDLLPKILPIPRSVESHDMWIALISVIYGTVRIIPETVLLRRIHNGNVTSPYRRALPIILKTRFLLLLSIIGRFWTRSVGRAT
jgi:glycosyltransferase involved in cell wall biosynthesis